MSRIFALFVVDDPIRHQLLLKDPNLLVNNPNYDIILDELAWCQFGETSEVGIVEVVPQAIQTIMNLLQEPRKLDDVLLQRILDILNIPDTNRAIYPTELVADAEGVRWFLEQNKDKEVSYFWL